MGDRWIGGEVSRGAPRGIPTEPTLPRLHLGRMVRSSSLAPGPVNAVTNESTSKQRHERTVHRKWVYELALSMNELAKYLQEACTVGKPPRQWEGLSAYSAISYAKVRLVGTRKGTGKELGI